MARAVALAMAVFVITAIAIAHRFRLGRPSSDQPIERQRPAPLRSKGQEQVLERL